MSKKNDNKLHTSALDKWILSELNIVIRDVKHNYQNTHDIRKAVISLLYFYKNICGKKVLKFGKGVLFFKLA